MTSITRLIGEDIREPGCTIKGHKARYVPLHPEIVKRLIPYMEKQVAEHGHGPLPSSLPGRCDDYPT
jgi:hypothetical protein